MKERYKRNSPFTDIKSADEWFVRLMLESPPSLSSRLLNTTKLTELIYKSFITENMPFSSQTKQHPVNAEALIADLFGALLSPVIRKKDNSSVNLRERTFNKPILDRVLTDDRFDKLKTFCENKELTSYEAASSFTIKLCECLTNKPFCPEIDYFNVIEMLTRQIGITTEQIRKEKAESTKPEKLLLLYRRINNKLSQIADLKKKLAAEALCYIQSISADICAALETAVERTEELNCIMTAWGTDSGEMKNIPINRDLIQHVKNSEELLKIAKSLGKYKEIIADKRKNSFAYGRGEKYDLTTGNDIQNCLSSELALLGTSETEILFMRKYEQKRLTQYRKRTEIVKGKGDMIVLIDESSSTRNVQAWAKAFALAMLDIATKDRRKFAMVHFASEQNVKTDLFEPGHYTTADVMRAAEQFFGGETDFEAPLTEAINLMEKGYENADITIITDGECRLSDKFAEKFRSTMIEYKASVTGILLDKDSPCGKTLEPFCDRIYHSRDITEDDIAVRILNNKV